MNIVIQIVCLLALVFAIFAWYLSLMEFLVNLYIHRDNQLRGKKDEESDFVNTREMIKEDIVNFFNKIPENSPASVGSGMNPVFLYVKSFFFRNLSYLS